MSNSWTHEERELWRRTVEVQLFERYHYHKHKMESQEVLEQWDKCWLKREALINSLEYPCGHHINEWKKTILLPRAEVMVRRETISNWTFECQRCFTKWKLKKPEELKCDYFHHYHKYYWQFLIPNRREAALKRYNMYFSSSN